MSLRSDRTGHRTLYLALGAFVAAFFSLTAGVAATIGLFGVSSRAGFGFGLIVNDPVQQSLLSGYAPVRSRPSVFAGRQIADNLGGLMGPLVFGLMAWAIGWPHPLILVAVMAVVIGVLSLRLREPSKGGMERLAMGATGADLDAEEEPAGFREAYRILKVIPTCGRCGSRSRSSSAACSGCSSWCRCSSRRSTGSMPQNGVCSPPSRGRSASSGSSSVPRSPSATSSPTPPSACSAWWRASRSRSQ